MNKEFHKKLAKDLLGEGCCYIHAEKRKGKDSELCIAGDFLAMIHCMAQMAIRIGQITDTDYTEVLQMVATIPHIGVDNIHIALENEPKKAYVGDDWDEQWKADMTKKIQKENASENITMAFNLAEMEKKCTVLNNQNVDLNKTIKAKDKQIKELSKEIQSLEHRLLEMEKNNLFPEQ